MTQGTLLTDGARPAVRLERELPDAPPVVWRALTERDQLAAWFPCDVIVSGGAWVVGATISFPFSPDKIDMTLSGQVIAVDEPNTLSFTWGDETLRFELTPTDTGGTLLVMVDELPPSAAARNAAGWDECLDRLAGVGSGAESWRTRFDAYTAQFEPVVGPQEGPPTVEAEDPTKLDS
jgi:uncharacterized protein YndB with AHSA1/START domain